MASDRFNAQTGVAQLQDQNPARRGIGYVDAVATEDLGELLRGVGTERIAEEVVGLREVGDVETATAKPGD
jgi:hypothetical protein